MKKFIILSTVLLWFALGFFALYLVNRPTASLKATKADFSVSSPDFYAAFEQNETIANQQYLGKVIEVSGTVSEITIENGKMNITLAGDDMFGVTCKMNGDGQKLLEKINKGDGIVVKGMCSGKLMDVVLVNCDIQKS